MLPTFAVPDQEAYLLPQLSSLPFNTDLLPPDTVKQIKSGKLDLKKVAVSLVERKRQFQNRWKSADDEETAAAKQKFPKCDDIEILSFFPEQYIDALIKKGQLNMHQTGQSRGLTQREVRAKAENSMIGIKFEEKHNENPKSVLHYLRPKYGLVNFPSPCGIRVNPNRLLIYGQVIIVYNDDVKLRTTYSYGDSLFAFCHYLAGDLKQYQEPHSLLDFASPQKNETSDVRYVEAQIWGPIDLNDIKEFRVPDDRGDLVDKLKTAGKPVYSYTRENMINCDMYMDEALIGIGRGNKLFDPSQTVPALGAR